MLLRALIAFLALPGVVAFAIPLLVFERGQPVRNFHPAGAAVLAAGVFVLAWYVRDFYVLGRGTLAPWDPPKALVIRGLYRYSRNPMYVGVLLILAGWALGFRSTALACYAIGIGILFHLRVLLNEEPFLARTHGQQWINYRATVPRWLLRWPHRRRT
jgi:protein-S-isoprenylcysteine O-methyltransferase Ste14